MIVYYGPIEEFQVRDCVTGEDETFSDYAQAEQRYMAWIADRADHPIMLIAVVASS